MSRRWHRNRLVSLYHRKLGKGFYLGPGPGGAMYMSRSQVAFLRNRIKSGNVPIRVVPGPTPGVLWVEEL